MIVQYIKKKQEETEAALKTHNCFESENSKKMEKGSPSDFWKVSKIWRKKKFSGLPRNIRSLPIKINYDRKYICVSILTVVS